MIIDHAASYDVLKFMLEIHNNTKFLKFYANEKGEPRVLDFDLYLKFNDYEELNFKGVRYNEVRNEMYFLATDDDTDKKIQGNRAVMEVSMNDKHSKNPNIFLVKGNLKDGFMKAPLSKIQRGGLFFNLIADESKIERIDAIS